MNDGQGRAVGVRILRLCSWLCSRDGEHRVTGRGCTKQLATSSTLVDHNTYQHMQFRIESSLVSHFPLYHVERLRNRSLQNPRKKKSLWSVVIPNAELRGRQLEGGNYPTKTPIFQERLNLAGVRKKCRDDLLTTCASKFSALMVRGLGSSITVAQHFQCTESR
ncbi:hypothetical protein FA15DRAFT_249684 [Coprinopsis marcescibilis]|uniref:Uncharacterized protein n=1 Tax=Coprinopsis marcescibilis TaxID=230819 RepID=A0A5C3KEN1_COPMA|nr:hypothetical protein FA15DRAFT_249684 [Coprinopsis marcescibilis]